MQGENPQEQKQNEEAQLPITYGERLVGIRFNPSGDYEVSCIKDHFAWLIDILNGKVEELQKKMSATPANFGEQIRHLKIAITEAQTAQMWAVKAVTFEK